MTELLNAALDRLKAMRAETELLVHALTGAVVLAVAEDARATAAINNDDTATLDAQRKTELEKNVLESAWHETRSLSNAIADRLETLQGLKGRLVTAG